MEEAALFFALWIADVGNVECEVTSECFRTGYNFAKEKIVFCDSPNVLNAGQSSSDVVKHESAHALIFKLRPDWANMNLTPEARGISEALADLFAREFDNNNFFGENFYIDKNFIRQYENDYDLELAYSPYHIAGALNRAWREKGITFKDFKEYILYGELTFDSLKKYELLDYSPNVVEVIFDNLTFSQRNRYRIPRNGAFFHLRNYDRNYEISLVDKDETPGQCFVLKDNKIVPLCAGAEKLFLRFTNKGTVKGAIPLYLSVQHEK